MRFLLYVYHPPSTQYTLTTFEVDFLRLLRLLSVPLDYHRCGSVSTAVAHDTPLSWLGIYRGGSWYPTVVARYPPSWLMILHHRGSVSTIVTHDTPSSWLGIHRRGSWYPTVVAHDTPLSWLSIHHHDSWYSTIVAHDTPPSWLGTLYPGLPIDSEFVYKKLPGGWKAYKTTVSLIQCQ